MDNSFEIPYELFSISATRGFLPERNPLTQLSPISIFNEKLNEIASNLPVLLKEKYLRSELDKLNLEYAGEKITLTEKNHDAEQQIAILILLMLAQGYIWENPDKPADFIPTILAENIYPYCKLTQRFPTLSYTDYVLQNWRLKNIQNDISLNNIDPIITFTNTTDEAWFIKIHVVIEKKCGKALHAAYQIWHLAYSINSISQYHVIEKICLQLNEITNSINDALCILKKMVQGCNPDFFWSTLRYYLNGWEKVKIKTTENIEEIGVKLNGITQNKLRYRGASGAQSSIIQALDAALGIKHEIDNMHQIMLTYRQYMPSQHSLFIHFLSSSNIIQVIRTTCSQELVNAWKQAIDQLKLFRLEHIKLVSQYIYHPAEKRGADSHEITGTGGTSITDYLDNRYENTHKSMIIKF